jgi:hypothetical protein
MRSDSAKPASPGLCTVPPVLWLGAFVLAASLAGCVLMIILGARHSDEALPTAGGEIVHMPLARPTDSKLP